MHYIADVIDWLERHAALSTVLIAASIVALCGSLWGVHRFLVTIPPEYFAHEHKRFELWRNSHPALRWTVLIAKNLLGALLILAGVIMLFTPGQGILSILLGISLADLPGKRTLERMIIQRPSILRIVNRLRAKADQPPLRF